jgi:hypothetical protein
MDAQQHTIHGKSTMNTLAKLALSTLALTALATSTLADGRNPGSLLLYPEFRQGGGADTIFTVTNTNPTTGVRVHIWYVSGDTTGLCTESNRIANLLPSDTFTALVSAHLGTAGPSKGFLYIYAETAGGAAMSFNYLVGDLLIVDGGLTAQYSVDPLPFTSPRADGLTTDVDNDGLRDFNDLEYERAPDKVLIPRFMGQSAAAPFQSDLILLSLSGGSRFETLVDFLVFNDNEEVFSAQAVFKCWTKATLLSYNGIFGKSFLQNNTNDNANEILGAPTEEAGWIWIDGNIATSTTTDIPNPVVIALLIERSGAGETGAELPFLVGKQLNADLLPGGNGWDHD